MNLYAIRPVHSPNSEVSLVLAESDGEALLEGIFAAALDVANGNYFSPAADVYLVARELHHVGKAWATDAPREWEWAHPAVEENAARDACTEVTTDDL
jgi:hypothetical protein